MADNTNPFVGLVTPDVLEAQRQQQADQGVQLGANIWQQMAANAGLATRKVLAAHGLGNEEDRKALRNEQIMQDSTRKYSALLQQGMTADDAQAAILEDAIKQFADNGDYQQALALTQPLNALKSQALERRKLRADAAAQEAKPDLMDAQQQALIAKMAQADQALELKRQAIEAAVKRGEDANTIAQMRLQLQADALDLKRMALEAKQKGGIDTTSAAAQKLLLQTDDNLLAASQAADLMTNITKVATATPAALTKAGGWASAISGMASSARAAMSMNGYDLGSEDEKVIGALRKANIADSQLQSMALDLAYAFARVRDPGGRLSNQDVNMALQIVQGKGSPQAMLKTLHNNYLKLVKDTDNLVKVRTHQGFQVDEEAQNVYNTAKQGYDSAYKAAFGPKPPVAPPRAPGAAPAAAPAKTGTTGTTGTAGEQWTIGPDGMPVRVK